MTTEPRSNVMKWTGLGLFVGGMSVGLYAFIHNKNGSYAEFGEADAVNKKLGAASLAAAFAGGALLFAGTRKAPRRDARRQGRPLGGQRHQTAVVVTAMSRFRVLAAVAVAVDR